VAYRLLNVLQPLVLLDQLLGVDLLLGLLLYHLLLFVLRLRLLHPLRLHQNPWA